VPTGTVRRDVAGVVGALIVGVSVFVVGTRADARPPDCTLQSSRSLPPGVLTPDAARMNTGILEVVVTPTPDTASYALSWFLERRKAAGWEPAWQLLATLDGTRGDIVAFEDERDVAGYALDGNRTLSFPLPAGLRSGSYRLSSSVRRQGALRLQVTLLCSGG